MRIRVRGYASGKQSTFLPLNVEIFDDHFNLTGDNVTPRAAGAWLSGIDSDGSVYFAEVHPLRGATVIQSKLFPQQTSAPGATSPFPGSSNEC